MLNLVFRLKLINDVINSKFFLEKLYIKSPVRPTRCYNFIYRKYYADYADFDPFRRICNVFNNLYLVIDCNKNLESIKKSITLQLN